MRVKTTVAVCAECKELYDRSERAKIDLCKECDQKRKRIKNKLYLEERRAKIRNKTHKKNEAYTRLNNGISLEQRRDNWLKPRHEEDEEFA